MVITFNRLNRRVTVKGKCQSEQMTLYYPIQSIPWISDLKLGDFMLSKYSVTSQNAFVRQWVIICIEGAMLNSTSGRNMTMPKMNEIDGRDKQWKETENDSEKSRKV